MKKLILATILMFPLSVSAKPVRFEENVVVFNPAPVCADLIGIPRNSDNFGYPEWIKFQKCISYFESVNGTFN
jgi:hypothetical protein